MDSKEKDQVLHQILTDPASPVSFSGVQKIPKEFQKGGIKDITNKDMIRYLQTQDFHTFLKELVANFLILRS